MWDLKLALHFVQENIGHLGGDPEKATTITTITTIIGIITINPSPPSPPSLTSSPPTLTFCLQVTLFGQSAGAMAVQNLMLSPHTKDKELFRFPEW